jgi:hypothetical protein
VATVSGLAVATGLLAVRDPHVRGSWGFCPIRLATGYDCPLCGGLRAVNDLTAGDLGAAVSSNVVVVLALPVVATALVVWLLRRWRGTGHEEPPLPSPAAGWVLLGCLMVFAVVRNLPFAATLASG